jgi:branched-chain amino acid transport system permease protein
MTAKIPNFAHGTYAGFGVYISYTITRMWGLNVYIAFPIAFIFGGVLAAILYLIVISTLNKMGGGPVVLTIATIAIGLFLTQIIHVYAYWARKSYGEYAYDFLLKQFDFEFYGIQGIFPVSIILCAIIVVLLHIMLRTTKLGISMRATCEDPMLSSIMGINTYRVQLFSWFLTGGLACLSGATIPLWFMGGPDAGGNLLSSTMAGSLLGGLENIYGAVVGGFGIAIIEILGTTLLQNWVGIWVGEYRPIVPLIITILVLLIEPSGLSGRIERWRTSTKGKRMIASLSYSSIRKRSLRS